MPEDVKNLQCQNKITELKALKETNVKDKKGSMIDAATGEEETCASVLSRSIRLAQCFGRLGLVPGDPIVVGSRNHLDGHIPFYAGMLSGQPIAAIDPGLKSSELKHLLNIIKPKVAFCEYVMHEEYKNAVQELGIDTKIVTFGGGENSFAKCIEAHVDLQPEDQFKVATFNTDEVYSWLISTSGSTGQPKVVALTHSHILQMLYSFAIPDAKDGGRHPVLNIPTLHWLTGCFNALLMPIYHIKLQTSAPITTDHLIDIINKYKPKAVICTPTALAPILSHKKHCDLTCFDFLMVGGSKVHTEFLIGLKERVHPNAVICHGVGMTEIGGVIMQSTSLEPLGNLGKPHPNFEAKLVEPETGKEVTKPNVNGELYLRGPLMACYYNDPKETKNAFSVDGYFKTGDLYYKDEHGNYFFVDRLKMLLKYRNYQIVPPEVEAVILRHAGVADVCVTGAPHAQDGEHAVACVVPKPGAKITAQEIKDIVAEHLSASKHLHGGVVFLDALPLTASGKIARLEVKKLVLTAHRE